MSFIVCPTNHELCVKDYIFSAVSFLVLKLLFLKLLGMFKACMRKFDQKYNILKRYQSQTAPPPGIIVSTFSLVSTVLRL